jgi:hypothetical protein
MQKEKVFHEEDKEEVIPISSKKHLPLDAYDPMLDEEDPE